mgnify:CR=1 FL=1
MRRRHWKEKFDPKADMIVLKRMVLKGVQHEYGDDIDTTSLGAGKLLAFWKAGVIGLKPSSAIVPTGKGNWHKVTFPDGSTKQVNGLKKAQEALEKWTKTSESS